MKESEILSELQEMALNACSTLVSVEPTLTSAMRDSVLQVCFSFLLSCFISGTIFRKTFMEDERTWTDVSFVRVLYLTLRN